MIISGFVLRDQRNFKKITVLTRKLECWYIERGLFNTWVVRFERRVGALADVILGGINRCNTRTNASSYQYDNVISYHVYVKE